MNTEAKQILDSFPRLDLGRFPTPVEPLARTSPLLTIKRDDYTGPGFGGNKVRKLEYELAEATRKGHSAVITTGGLRSNHCRVTAALAARLGLRCILVLNGAPAKTKPASLALDEWYGAEIVFVGHREDRAPTMAELAGRTGGYVIPLGASTPLGALGFVRAVFELEEKPARIVHATSSAGTQAGLAAGLTLRGWQDVELIGVSADDPALEIADHVREIIRGIAQLLGPLEPPIPILVRDEYVGPGYGIPTFESNVTLRLLARTEGVLLDPVYTAKAMTACLDLLHDDPKPTLFWHTGGQLALFDLAAGFE